MNAVDLQVLKDHLRDHHPDTPAEAILTLPKQRLRRFHAGMHDRARQTHTHPYLGTFVERVEGARFRGAA